MRTAIAVTAISLVKPRKTKNSGMIDAGTTNQASAASSTPRTRPGVVGSITQNQAAARSSAKGMRPARFRSFAQKPFSTMRAWRSSVLGRWIVSGNLHAMTLNIGRGVLRGKGLRVWTTEKALHRRRRGARRVPQTSGEHGGRFLARLENGR